MPSSPVPLLGLSPLEWRDARIWLVDQSSLPGTLQELPISDCERLVQAIQRLEIRGAPALGLAGAWGVALACHQALPQRAFKAEVRHWAARLRAARATAVNLVWAVDRVMARLDQEADGTCWPALAVEEAGRIQAEDRQACHDLCTHALDWIVDGCWLTICNAGPLATSGIGTAQGALLRAHAEGRRIEVLACETRPLLQGARLTTWEMQRANVPCRLITDSMAAAAMRQLEVKGVIVGADRIAANGDTANKVGSYSLALAARFHQIPFLVAAPESSRDPQCPQGIDIPIEERDPAEVRGFACHGWDPVRWAPGDVACWNPAFDVIPAELITAIITEKGATRPTSHRGAGHPHKD